jgi:transposase-like protein
MSGMYRQTIAVNSTQETLRVIQSIAQPGDNVIEIGTQLGIVTTTVRDIVQQKKMIKMAKEKVVKY